MEDAITDVLHRTLFGVLADVNVHPPEGPPPPALELGLEMLELLHRATSRSTRRVRGTARSSPCSPRVMTCSSAAAITTRGVDPPRRGRGVSHGAFYRYLPEQGRARGTATAVGNGARTDGARGDPRCRRRRWTRGHRRAAAVAARLSRGPGQRRRNAARLAGRRAPDPTLRAESASPLDWGRRRLACDLQPRCFGDVDMEAVVMMSLLTAFGVVPAPCGRRRGGRARHRTRTPRPRKPQTGATVTATTSMRSTTSVPGRSTRTRTPTTSTSVPTVPSGASPTWVWS